MHPNGNSDVPDAQELCDILPGLTQESRKVPEVPMFEPESDSATANAASDDGVQTHPRDFLLDETPFSPWAVADVTDWSMTGLASTMADDARRGRREGNQVKGHGGGSMSRQEERSTFPTGAWSSGKSSADDATPVARPSSEVQQLRERYHESTRRGTARRPQSPSRNRPTTSCFSRRS